MISFSYSYFISTMSLYLWWTFERRINAFFILNIVIKLTVLMQVFSLNEKRKTKCNSWIRRVIVTWERRCNARLITNFATFYRLDFSGNLLEYLLPSCYLPKRIVNPNLNKWQMHKIINRVHLNKAKW